MPRRNNRVRRAPRLTGGPAEKPLTYDAMALRLVRDGRASVRVLGPLHPRVTLPNWTTDQTDNSTTDNPQKEDNR